MTLAIFHPRVDVAVARLSIDAERAIGIEVDGLTGE